MGARRLDDADKLFEQECVTLLREIESLTKSQELLWDEVSSIVTHNEDVALQVEMISDSRRHQLYNAQEKAAQLAQSIADSARIAKDSSKRVKEMDNLKSRVDATLELANGIAKQRTLLEGTTNALLKFDFEGAAEFIASYCEIEAQLQDVARLEEGDEIDEPVDPSEKERDVSRVDAESLSGDSDIVEVQRPGYSLRETSTLLQKKREEVRSAIRVQFNEAASECDRDGVLRLSKLFGKLGLEDEGRLQYCNWLRQACGAQLKDRVESALAEIERGTSQCTHLDLVSDVIDHVVNALESEEEHVQGYFGGKGIVSMFAALHGECTSHSVVILDSFLKNNQAVLFSLNNAPPAGSTASLDEMSQSPRAGSGASILLDKKTMDKTLEEISHVANFCNLYFNFIKDRLQQSGEVDVTKTPSSPKSSVDEALGDSKLQEKLQELLHLYAPLQKKYLVSVFEHASAQACRKVSENHTRAGRVQSTYEVPDAGNGNSPSNTAAKMGAYFGNLNLAGTRNILTTAWSGDKAEDSLDLEALITMVDDVFTVLRTCLTRAVRIRTVHVMRRIVNSINDLLRDYLLQLIMEKLVFRKGEAVVGRSCLVWLDVLHTSQLYTTKLSTEFERLVHRHIGGSGGGTAAQQQSGSGAVAAVSQADVEGRELLDTVGSELEATTDTLADVLSRNIEKIAEVITRQMQLKGLHTFEQLSYVIGEEKLGQYEINDAWVRAAILQWGGMFQYYQEHMGSENFDSLVVEIVTWLTKKMEELILLKQFDLCGGLQIDKDIRAVKQYFSAKTDRPIREKFTKLTHIAQLLTVEKVAEVEDLLNSSSCVMWRLTPAEAQQVLLLRRDITPASLQTISFHTVKGH
eukprot:TRINITY_DN693_c1_g1_i2.p1 TRINITY_DN693_c1_g1~~TRINITY_DN693_c1_g1_i2.p1  ORF type:complete len:890 (+),score=404.28 TRINITY_DN693_c1_g1_i2:86-2671(+)